MFQPMIYYIVTRDKVSETFKRIIQFLKLSHFQSFLFENTIQIGIIRNGQTNVVKLMLYLIILLTFGLTYPILALLLTSTIIIEVFNRRIEIGIVLQYAIIGIDVDCLSITHFYNPIHLKQLETQLVNCWKVVDSCYWLLQLTVTFFWSLLFIDMIDNQYGMKIGLITSMCYFISSNLLIQIIKVVIIKRFVWNFNYFQKYLSIFHKKNDKNLIGMQEMNDFIRNPIQNKQIASINITN